MLGEIRRGSKEGRSFQSPPGWWFTATGGSIVGYFFCEDSGNCSYSHDPPGEGFVCVQEVQIQPLMCYRSRPQPQSYWQRFKGDLGSLGKGAWNALGSDCVQGIAAIAALTGIAVGSVGSGVVFVQAGGVLTISAEAAATSAAAAGAATLGPIPSETVTKAINLALTTRKVESCAP
jgi:hypothetical protein